MSNEPITVSMKEACRLTGLSRATLDRMAAAGKLTKIKIGKKVLFRYDDLRMLVSNTK